LIQKCILKNQAQFLDSGHLTYYYLSLFLPICDKFCSSLIKIKKMMVHQESSEEEQILIEDQAQK